MQTLICGECGDNPASFVITWVKGGGPPEERLICPDCAERLERQAFGTSGPLSPSALVTRLNNHEEEPSFRCPDCGYDIEDLARTGKLGCQNCYVHFAEQVRDMVSRSIGRTQHRGKSPPPRLDSQGG
jgi:protein arginine kinase activator